MAGGKTISPSKARGKTKKKQKSNVQHSVKPHGLAPPPSRYGHPSLPPPSSPALEACLSRILLLRLRQDIARLYSAHLVRICEDVLPVLMLDIIALTGPGWIAANARSEELKSYFRGCIAMDLRQVGERVGTKSLIWSYTAIRDFVSYVAVLGHVAKTDSDASFCWRFRQAVARDIPLCPRSGIHSYSLVPYTNKIKAHMQLLETLAPPTFLKPHTMGKLLPNFDLLDKHCDARARRLSLQSPTGQAGVQELLIPPAWRDWKGKLKIGYDLLVEILWETANEFNPAGFAQSLTERLTTNWCECGCSWDWLGEVSRGLLTSPSSRTEASA